MCLKEGSQKYFEIYLVSVTRVTNDAGLNTHTWTVEFTSNVHDGNDFNGDGVHANGYSTSWGQNVGNIPQMLCVDSILSDENASVQCNVSISEIQYIRIGCVSYQRVKTRR